MTASSFSVGSTSHSWLNFLEIKENIPGI